MNCHPRDDRPRQGDDRHKHLQNIVRGEDNMGFVNGRCNACHRDENNDYSGVPGAPSWHLAPLSMGWQGLNDADLCAALKDETKNGGKDVAALVTHMKDDKLVLWGWQPGGTRAPVSTPHPQFMTELKAWAAAGAPCPAASARLNISNFRPRGHHDHFSDTAPNGIFAMRLTADADKTAVLAPDVFETRRRGPRAWHGRTDAGTWTARRQPQAPEALAPNPFLVVAPDNTVTVIIKHLDKGQGAATGLATLVAEELDADWAQIKTEFAPADPVKYKNFAFGVQGVGGSTGLANSYEQYRLAGATAKAMIVAAAARKWGVKASDITGFQRRVVHAVWKNRDVRRTCCPWRQQKAFPTNPHSKTQKILSTSANRSRASIAKQSRPAPPSSRSTSRATTCWSRRSRGRRCSAQPSNRSTRAKLKKSRASSKFCKCRRASRSSQPTPGPRCRASAR